MSPREFFDLVCKMRKAQKRFFDNSSGLSDGQKEYISKIILESQVDKEIERVNAILNNNLKVNNV